MNLVSFTNIGGTEVQLNPDHVVYIRQTEQAGKPVTRIVVIATENGTGGIQPGYFDVFGQVPEIRQKLMETTIPPI